MAFTSDPKAASRELERRKAECYNREEGTLNQQDNDYCPLCRNRGKTVELVMEDGEEKAKFFECRCMNIRSTIARMQRSGRILSAPTGRVRLSGCCQKSEAAARIIAGAKPQSKLSPSPGSNFVVFSAAQCLY